MSKRRPDPTVEQLDDSFFKFQLEQESDRACAVLGAAHLDFLLGKAIENNLPNVQDVADGLLRNPKAPLATFSARIDLAYALGIIDNDTRDDLNNIREIRNDFAHQVQVHSFDDDDRIRDKCMNLSRAVKFADDQPAPHRENLLRPRNLFVFTAVDIQDQLRVLARMADKKPERILMVKEAEGNGSQPTDRQISSESAPSASSEEPSS